MNKPGSSLSQFIEEYPLYSKFATDQPIEAADLNNLAFNFFCKKENEIQPFRLRSTSSNGIDHSVSSISVKTTAEGSKVDFTEMFSGICQSCENYQVNIVISGATQKERPKYFIRKIGQYPAPETLDMKFPRDISDFLNEEDRELYRKGLKNLELEHGAGAFAYFRRMIENEIERIVEALSDPYSPGGNKIAESFAAYKNEKQKTKFVEDITPLLPKNLKDHGAQLIILLHDAACTGVDNLTEKECLKKSKDIDTMFRYIIRKLNAELDETLHKKAPDKYFLRYT